MVQKNAENKVVKSEESKAPTPPPPAETVVEVGAADPSGDGRPGTDPLDPDEELEAAARRLEAGLAAGNSTFAQRKAARLARDAANAAAAAAAENAAG